MTKTFKQIFNQTLSLSISFSLIFTHSLQAASIEIDTNANAKHQATLDYAPNNIRVVNIVTPDANGLSHNKFKHYNVNKEGLILNNANKANVDTQLAGYIYGNSNLNTSGPAQTILNQVTGQNKSYLRGATEVAGSAAHVIIANPNGIYMNGAGFINTPKVTITTGTPNFSNEKLNKLDILSKISFFTK